jgi:hypothetical protein
MDKFFIGLHHPHHAWPFINSMISINRIRNRQSNFLVNDWILDSGAFTQISTRGQWLDEPEVYAQQINRWKDCGNLLAAVTQDMMCEPFILEKTGLTVGKHQEITVDRYRRIINVSEAYVMPVLQGFEPRDYVYHLEMYGDLLEFGQWVGVGSVCKRNSDADAIEDVMLAIKSTRPDLKLHGFGIKTTSLQNDNVRDLLYSSDSMAWSFAGRRDNDDLLPGEINPAHDPREALKFAAKIEDIIKRPMFIQPALLQWWK